MQREKRTKSGRLFEASFYPVLADGRRVPTRAPKTKRSTAEQERYNHKKAAKNFTRLVNANMFTGDIWMSPTYRSKDSRYDIKDAKADIARYVRRVKAERRAELRRVNAALKLEADNKELKERARKLAAPFKYAYRIEENVYKRGERRGQRSYHFHIFMTGGLSRDVLEEMWTLGCANADRYRPEEFGPQAAALYSAKNPNGGKVKFGYSKNLDRPVELPPIDGKITARGVERLAKLHIDDAKYWERRYRGYKFLRCYSIYNEYNGYWYVSVVMYKPEGDGPLPEWTPENWIDEF